MVLSGYVVSNVAFVFAAIYLFRYKFNMLRRQSTTLSVSNISWLLTGFQLLSWRTLKHHSELRSSSVSIRRPYFTHQCNVFEQRSLHSFIESKRGSNFCHVNFQIFRKSVCSFFNWRLVSLAIWYQQCSRPLVCSLWLCKVQWNYQCWLYLFPDYASSIWSFISEKARLCELYIFPTLLFCWYAP